MTKNESIASKNQPSKRTLYLRSEKKDFILEVDDDGRVEEKKDDSALRQHLQETTQHMTTHLENHPECNSHISVYDYQGDKYLYKTTDYPNQHLSEFENSFLDILEIKRGRQIAIQVC